MLKQTIKTVLCAAASLLVFNTCATASQPNIVLIMADDLGYECIGANGGTSYKSPVLDKLAATGVRFEHCYSQPLCTPSRVQIMTGIYNVRNYTTFGVLDRGETTFAHLLKQSGYATCIAGKWQLGRESDSPQHFGFDQACLWQHTIPGPKGPHGTDNRFANPQIDINGKTATLPEGSFGPDVCADFICDFMETNKDKPFFVYYPMILTHCPFAPTPDSEDWDPKSYGSKTYEGDAKYFGDMVTYMDKIVGRITAKLDALGVRENTLVLFVGDNGTDKPVVSVMDGREVAGGKRLMTDAGTRVPLIASWPGTIAKGLVTSDLVDFSDFLPTLCETAGAPIPPALTIDGESFLPQLLGQEGNPREWIYSWYNTGGGPKGREWVRNQRYKLYRTGKFYDISNDVLEQQPLQTLSPKAQEARTLFEGVLNTYKDARPASVAAKRKQQTKKPRKKPNIVFILADDMSRDTWGTYGGVDCNTPNIDKLASEGMRFDRLYCSVAMCAPFRQELYSGRSPWRTGTLANHSKSKPGTQSIPHYLKPLGYRVALVGKSHVGPQQSYPFEYFSGNKDKSQDPNPDLLKAARTFIDSCKQAEKPFCLFIASNDSHAPFTTGDRSAYDAESLMIPPYWLDTPVLRQELVKYYAEVSNFDQLVGQMRDELEQRGLWDNTIFMVSSEQGTQLPFAKWTCYDNGQHSGLVAHWAGVTQPGSVAKELLSIADITPTLVEAAGGKLKPNDCDGQSFLKTLNGKPQVLHPYVYGAFSNCNIIGSRDRIFPVRVIRNKSFTLIYNPNHESQTSNTTLDKARAMLEDPAEGGNDIASSWVSAFPGDPLVHKLHHRPEYELYHLEKDPYELKNEIDNPEYSSVAEALKQQLHAKLSALGDADPIVTEKSLVKSGGAKKKKNPRKNTANPNL